MKTLIEAQNACLTWISDPGHAWLVVATDLGEFGMGCPEAVNFASQYSYFDGKNVYLEEDCDAPAFIKHYGIDLTQVPSHHFDDYDHFIRNLPSYTA